MYGIACIIPTGDEGIGPPTVVLETTMIPLHQSPNRGQYSLFFSFFVDSMCPAPFAVLLELDLARDEFSIFP